jgi:hypothetical protein
MRSYPRQEAVKFRNNASEEVVRGLGVSVLDPSPVSGPLLAVAAAPKGLHRAALHLLDLPRPAFLDSSLTDGHGGRYSFFTADPFLVLRSRCRRVELIGPAGRAVTEEDPWVLLQLLLRRYPVDRVAGLPLFLSGAVGYFGYDLGRTLERLPATAADEGLPELDVGFYDWVLAADHLSGESWIVATGLPTGQEADARARVAGIQERLNDTLSSSSNAASLNAPRLLSNLRRVDYLQAIERAREYIAAGDIFQVNLSHRLEGEWDGAAWPLYERLRTASPVSYGAYLDLGDVKVLSASPERFLKLDGRWIESRPTSLTLAVYEAHGLLAGALVFSVQAAHRAGNGHAPRLLYAPDRHTQVVGLYNDDGALGPEALVQGVGDLGGKALLELRTAGVTLYHPGQLRKPHNLTVGYVADVGFAYHRQEMVLTGRIERYVSNEDHLVVILLKPDGQLLGRIYVQPREEELVSPRYPRRRVP